MVLAAFFSFINSIHLSCTYDSEGLSGDPVSASCDPRSLLHQHYCDKHEVLPASCYIYNFRATHFLFNTKGYEEVVIHVSDQVVFLCRFEYVISIQAFDFNC